MKFRQSKPGGFSLVFGPILFIGGIIEKEPTAILIGLALIVGAYFLTKDW